MDYNEIMALIDDLKMEALEGTMPTWIAYEEIDKLMLQLNK